MKKIRYILITAVTLFIFGCEDDYLERYPLDRLSPETYFQTENELKTYTNSFYEIVPGAPADGGSSIWGTYIDDEAQFSVPTLISGTREVPTTGGGWSWNQLRNINFFLENIDKFPGDDETRNHYIGMARFFRAWFYFEKVARFGDVPWYSQTIATTDIELLQKPRDPRKLVMDSVLNDINYAIDHLRDQRSTKEITKWTALALKSRIFLFEGTFRKYHGLGSYEQMLDESINASQNLIQNSGYTIYTSTPQTAYHELFIATDAIVSEMILVREFDLAVPFTHSVNFRTNSSSYGRPGVEKQLINSYLMTDGSRFTDQPNYETIQFYEETQNRDPRLAQTIRTPGYKQIGQETTSVPDFTATMTGYQYIKYVLAPVHFSLGCDNDLPIFRFAEVLLNYAEAKAERGTLTQNDIDISIKLIRDRVDMPNINIADANSNPDEYLASQYKNVTGDNKGVILEIRRERRIELIRESFRWNDLMRWKEGHNVARPFLGMYFPGPGEYDLDQDGRIDIILFEDSEPKDKIPNTQYYRIGELDLLNGVNGGNIIVNRTVPKKFDENKDYYYPIPTQERILNKNLTQNPGWDDGLGY